MIDVGFTGVLGPFLSLQERPEAARHVRHARTPHVALQLAGTSSRSIEDIVRQSVDY